MEINERRENAIRTAAAGIACLFISMLTGTIYFFGLPIGVLISFFVFGLLFLWASYKELENGKEDTQAKS